MPQRQWRSDDTDKWSYSFGSGVDGAYNSTGNATDAPIDSSCSGTSGATSLSATNASFAPGQIILIHQSRGTGAGNWELNRISSYTSGTITTSHALMNTYTDSGASQAQVLVVKQYTSFTQNSGHTLSAKAWDGNVGGILAFFCNGTTTITGTLSTSGLGFTGGSAGRNAGGPRYVGQQGEGTAGVGIRQLPANGNGGGGGQYNDNEQGDAGAGGGHASAGADGNDNRGDGRAGGGSAVGTASLTTMVFGGGGGGGGFGDADPGAAFGDGGRGGGIIFIASNIFNITGSIVTTGNNGENQSQDQAAGGGGAGGAVLLKAKTATLGSNLITALAGSGFSGAGSGSVGRINMDYSASYTGTTNPTINVRVDPTITNPTGGSFIFNLL